MPLETTVKPMAKTKAKPKNTLKSKPAKSAAKAAKSAKPLKVVAKAKPAAAQKQKPIPAKTAVKKPKAGKKDAKGKTEELDLFDEGDVTESEELLEYQAELEITEEETEAEAEGDNSTEEVLADGTQPAVTPESEEDIVLTDADGNRYCRAKDCDQISSVESYCRYHYLLFWKKIQVRKEILVDGKLEKYVDDLTSRYPDKFLEVLRKDLRTTKDFLAAIAELEIDESAGEGEFEEDAQTYIDEVRGLSESAGAQMEDDEF